MEDKQPNDKAPETGITLGTGLVADSSGISLVGQPFSYHDLHITTERIERTSLFDLPFNYGVHCNRTTGWELWMRTPGTLTQHVIAGEFMTPGLRLDVNGVVICDSLNKEQPHASVQTDS